MPWGTLLARHGKEDLLNAPSFPLRVPCLVPRLRSKQAQRLLPSAIRSAFLHSTSQHGDLYAPCVPHKYKISGNLCVVRSFLQLVGRSLRQQQRPNIAMLRRRVSMWRTPSPKQAQQPWAL